MSVATTSQDVVVSDDQSTDHFISTDFYPVNILGIYALCSPESPTMFTLLHRVASVLS